MPPDDDRFTWERDRQPPAGLAELIEAEATRQGLERPEWVALHVQPQLAAGASTVDVARAVTAWRRDNPWWLQVSDGGVPVALEGEVHDVQVHRERRGDGRFAPREKPAKPGMNEALRALIRGADEDQADPNLVKLARLVTPPPASKPGPTSDQLNSAARRIVRGEPGSSGSVSGALADMYDRRRT